MKKRSSVNKGKKLIQSDIPSKPWYKNIMAIIAFFSAVVIAGTGALALFQQLKPTPGGMNTIIVFDRSLAMNEPFEQGTKLHAAIEALDTVFSTEVAKNADNLALRSFGGPCDGKTQMEIRFRQDNAERIKDRVRTFSAEGETTLVAAVIEAIGYFSIGKRFDGEHKRIILITGGAGLEGDDNGKIDSCVDDPIRYIRNRLETLYRGEEISISFRFIGMSLNTEEKKQLTAIAEETGGIAEEKPEDQLFFVESKSELENALTQIINIEPILITAKGMSDIMDNVTNYLNDAIYAINDEDYSAAQKGLQDAKSEFMDTQFLLTDYSQRLNIPEFHEEFQKLYELLNANRTIQERQLELLEVMIDQGLRGDNDAQRDTISEWNKMISEFNRNIRDMDKITREIFQRLRDQQESSSQTYTKTCVLEVAKSKQVSKKINHTSVNSPEVTASRDSGS